MLAVTETHVHWQLHDTEAAVQVPMAYDDWHCPRCGLTLSAPALPPSQVRSHACGMLHGTDVPLAREAA